MAVISIGTHPELTKERAQKIFSAHFAGKYEVNPTKVLARDFIVQKSAWTGVGVGVKQGKDGTALVFTPLIPSLMLRATLGGLIAYHLSPRPVEGDGGGGLAVHPERAGVQGEDLVAVIGRTLLRLPSGQSPRPPAGVPPAPQLRTGLVAL